MNLKLLNESINVLMVDDDRALQTAVSMYLASQNIKFHSVFSAAEALSSSVLDEMDVLLVDIQLPDMDGFECAKKIQNKTLNQFATLFLSGVSMDTHSICKGYDMGCVDYLLKPVDPEILLRKVCTAYEQIQQILELEFIVEEKLALEEELLKIDLDF